jgi:hypothetical protein
MYKKITYKYIKDYFKKYKCILLEKEYKTINTKMRYKCSCGNISYTTWNTFKRLKNHKCKKCLRLSKYSYKFIKNFFEKKDCILLEKDYVHSRKKMRYKCSCGNTSYTTFAMFRLGVRCKKCGGEKIRNSLKYTFEHVKKYFEKQNCKLLEKTYIDSNKSLKYKCSCGNISYVSFNHFKRGNRCAKCAAKNTAEKIRYKYSFVKGYFEKQNCILLSKKYENSNKKLKYKCKCGNTSHISFSSFLKGKRCKNCKSSNGEKLIKELLTKNKIKFESQKSFNGCRYKRILAFDFYIPNKNTCIEFDGQFHYEPKLFKDSKNYLQNYKTQKIRDNIKNKFCKNNNINLLRIPYWNYNNIKDILNKEGIL